MSGNVSSYVRTQEAPTLPPPATLVGVVGWIRANLLGGPVSILLTALAAYLIWVLVPPIWKFFVVNAIYTGTDRTACAVTTPGACYPYIADNFGYFMYGFYPQLERWRVNITGIVGIVSMFLLLWPTYRYRVQAAIFFFVIFPFFAFWLLHGGFGGLPKVETNFWGGVIVTLVVAVTGIVFSLPLGIALALGRRSDLPIIKFISVWFIEFWRGVPLVTVLFMASVMLPLFVPQEWSPDKLLRALVGVSLFSAAYMAEIVRGGLQAIPKGQYEGAAALGLSYWKTMYFIILPQALKIVIPGIVNTFIGLFKDTSLVFIIGLFDFLKTVQSSLVDPKWASPWTLYTGYAFAAVFYFICCYGMSRYSIFMERRLSAGQHR